MGVIAMTIPQHGNMSTAISLQYEFFPLITTLFSM